MQQTPSPAAWRSKPAPTGKIQPMTIAKKKSAGKTLPKKAEVAAPRHAGAKARAPEATKQDIIDVATREFAQKIGRASCRERV